MDHSLQVLSVEPSFTQRLEAILQSTEILGPCVRINVFWEAVVWSPFNGVVNIFVFKMAHRVLLFGHPSKSLPVHKHGQRVTRRDQDKEPHVELPPINEQRILNVALYNILGLPCNRPINRIFSNLVLRIWVRSFYTLLDFFKTLDNSRNNCLSFD